MLRKFEQARKHPSRMRTRTWKPYMFQWQPPDVALGGGDGGVGCSRMNKVEQVSTDDYQMSPADPRSEVWGSCTVISSASWLMVMGTHL